MLNQLVARFGSKRSSPADDKPGVQTPQSWEHFLQGLQHLDKEAPAEQKPEVSFDFEVRQVTLRIGDSSDRVRGRVEGRDEESAVVLSTVEAPAGETVWVEDGDDHRQYVVRNFTKAEIGFRLDLGPAGPDRRASERAEHDGAATLSWVFSGQEQRTEATVKNVSAGGALVQVQGAHPGVDASAKLILDGRLCFGEVRHSTSKDGLTELGLEFFYQSAAEA